MCVCVCVCVLCVGVGGGGVGWGRADPIERTPLLSHFQKSSDFAGYSVL